MLKHNIPQESIDNAKKLIDHMVEPLVQHYFDKLVWHSTFPFHAFLLKDNIEPTRWFYGDGISARAVCLDTSKELKYATDGNITIYWGMGGDGLIQASSNGSFGGVVAGHLDNELRKLVMRWANVESMTYPWKPKLKHYRWTDTTRLVTAKDGAWVGVTRIENTRDPDVWYQGPGYAAAAIVYCAARIRSFPEMHTGNTSMEMPP